jgi:putative Holliday junction resolvase
VTRVAAVDYGRRRIGLAICDPLGITVRGLETVERGPDLETGARRVAAALAREGAEAVIVGLPLHTDGRESEMSAEARRFAGYLEAALATAVQLVDEGLTTWEAEEHLRARGVPLREAKRSGALDREAACCLLRAWLRDRDQPDSGA